ncbi:hypothetical protein DSM104443_00612 [Usitatibacter rugosus]|uniref:Big-1 domain-containing protein n=1 Tax=Usitatibacter rugosus TaxID=2732067 RepID=A0A6M4GTE1_9PROT|nr:choice-of-anchor U domain-containing protein [Usitatibacter rugosus]QJR09563.1 hypothetical protein DSM104443_00612 [Usitatibacter rugosus]
MMTTLAQRAFAALSLALVATLAVADPKLVSALPSESPLTDAEFTVRMQVTGAGGAATVGATVNFSVSTATNASATLLQSSAITDASGYATIQARANDWAGAYTVTGTSGAESANLRVVNRARRFISVQDAVYGVSSIQIDTESATCVVKSYQRLQPSSAPGPSEQIPLGRAPEKGYVAFRLVHCEKPNVKVTLNLGGDVPAGSEMWIFGRTIGKDDAHWKRASSEAFGGGQVTFSVNDVNDGDDDRLDNDEILVPTAGILVPAASAYPLVQDIWWAGAAENGWGMSIVQHGATLFIVIYAYDDQGRPTWFVMPGGSWNAARTTYTGSVYTPRSSAYWEYDATAFVVGNPVGTVTVTFGSGSSATVAYTINGRSGTKNITRQAFGNVATPTLNGLTDMWWGGTRQNGWGIAVIQQYAQLFMVWFSFESNGRATWFVMPAGSWTAFDEYEGPVYLTSSSPWVGVPYDPSRFMVNPVGSFKLKVVGASATFSFNVENHPGNYALTRLPF